MARVAAAYSLLPDNTQVGGFDNRRIIDVMLNGRSSEAANLSWYFYERIPELRYIARYIANSVSMARLYVAEVTDDPLAPQSVGKRHPANDLMKAFGGGLDGRSELLDRLALHLTVPGDSVLMGPDGTGKGLKFPFDQFRAFSGSEVTSRNGVTYYTGPDQRAVPVPKGVLPVRVWRQHPKWWWDADSATRSSFSVLREIDLLDQHVHATAVSRLAGAGLLAIPDEITIPGDEEEIGGNEADAFVKKLTKIMSLAIKNRESAAAIVPIVLRGPGDLIAQIQHFDFSTKFDEKVPELRTLALHRLALGMDVPPEVLMGSSDSNHWCLDDKTQVYTHRGWVSESSIEIGDLCLSMNHETGMSEWQPVTDVYRKDVVDEPMLSIEGSWHSSLTTMGHRWPVLKAHGRDKHWEREWTTSQDILGWGQRCAPNSQIPMKLQRAARLSTLPTEPKYQDALVELVAWMFTEGGLEYREGAELPKATTISQSHVVNSANCTRIRNALTLLYGPPSRGDGRSRRNHVWWREIREDSRRTCFVLSQQAAIPIIEHCPHRMVSDEFIDSLTFSQLGLFIETAALGDGHIRPTGNMHIGQKDPHMLDCVERAAILMGLGVIRYSCYQGGFDKGPQLQHYVSITPNRLEFRPRGESLSEVIYTGRIWCPTVPPNHSIFIMRDGKTSYTGQSAFQTDQSTVRLHTTPLVQLICGALTQGWLRPMLKTLPLSDTIKAQIPNLVVWYDLSNLGIRPNISGDAQALYDRFEGNGDTLRSLTGLSKSSAPNKKELGRMILLKLLQDNAELAPYALNTLISEGYLELPKIKEPAPVQAPEGRPPENTPVDSDPNVDVPGKRSKDKQISPPPAPPADGDGDNNG